MAVIKILDINKFTRKLIPVTTTEIKTRSGEFNPHGLFSEEIFGAEGSLDRAKTFSYIQLSTKIIHPTLFRHIMRLEGKLEKWLSTEQSYSITESGELVEDDEGVAGIKAFINEFPKIKWRGGTPQRDSIINLIEETYNSDTLFIDKIPVLPPDVRPYFEDESGQAQYDELNTVYMDIIRKSFQISSAGSSGQFFDLLNWGLQIAINNHDKFIKQKIAKKDGLIRENMLGKRIDFSGRAVITPGPQLNINEVGVPLRMAVQLFQPFLLHYILFSKKYPYKNDLEKEIKIYMDTELTVDSIQKLCKSIKTGDDIPEKLYQLIFDATEIVMKNRVLILKRDPALHYGSLRAFNPILTRNNTIELSTLQVGSFGADFDGDQMAIYHPISEEAQAEVKEKMMQLSGKKNDNDINIEISKEMCVGLYMMTKPSSSKSSPIGITQEDLDNATDPYIPVKYKGKSTTMGRAIFNNCFPPDFPFINEIVNNKLANKLITVMVRNYGDEATIKTFSKVKNVAFKFATIMAPSFSIDMFEMPESIDRIKEKLKTADTDEAFKLLEQGETIMKEKLKNTTFHDLIDSGSAKGWDQPKQMFVAKGVISDPKGKVLDPISGSFTEGLEVKDFFTASSGARKGMADRALNTADTGYFTRQLVFLLNSVEVDPNLRDCKTKRTINIRLNKDMISRLTGRYILVNGKLEKFDPNKYKSGDSVELRTPIYCRSPKICHTCYGDLIKKIKTPYVGVLAGASIGERGTQLIMKTFHTGGAATMAQHDILKEIIDNDPLADLEK